MDAPLPPRRTVISDSFSVSNPDAVAVAEALAARGIALGSAGPQLLAWAAAYLAGATAPIADAPPADALDAAIDDALEDW